MKQKTACGKQAATAFALVLALAGGLSALEPPTKEQWARYRADGSLARRIAAARVLGNDRINPGLVRDFRLRLDRLRREIPGRSDREADDVPSAYPDTYKPAFGSRGVKKTFVLLLDFPDYPSTNSAASIDGKIFGDGEGGYPFESLRNYYRRSSYGALEIRGTTLGWYRPAYSRDSIPEEWGGQEALIMEALNYFDAQGHDFSVYDNDNDGAIDYFLVVWSGPVGEWASFWWGYFAGWGSSFALDGKSFAGTCYSWQWECYVPGEAFSPETAIHETGHALGLPDLYDYDDSVGPDGGVGGLDVMDGRGDHNGFSKILLDWLTPSVCTDGTQTLALRPAATSKDAVLFWPTYDTARPLAEFFFVQNRTRAGNDVVLPGEGLLLWHVDARWNEDANSFLFDNSYTAHKYMRVMEADGLEEIEKNGGGDAGDFYVEGCTFDSSTTPNSNAYDGTRTDASLDEIARSGEAVTCRFSFIGNVLRLYVDDPEAGTTRPAPGTYTYPPGAAVKITAVPSARFTFTGWTGDAEGMDNPQTVRMGRDKSVTAHFRKILPPAGVAAVRQVCRSVTMAEPIIDFTWAENPANAGLAISGYGIEVKKDGGWSRLVTLEAGARSWRYRQAPADSRTYGLVALSADGNESDRAEIVK